MPRYAAVDIGSNSIRMLAADAVHGAPPEIVVAEREVTRLGSSVFSGGRISGEAIDRVCLLLRRFAETISKLNVVGTRAVATSAVRDASNQSEFLDRASEALGSPVEIISGQEEARLIFLGVHSRWRDLNDRSIIMDVGGGSAEFIDVAANEMKAGISRPLGAVRLSEVFLLHDPPTDTELHRMNQFIDDKFEPALHRLQPGKYDRMIATAATAAAIVSAVHRVPRSERETADRLRANVRQIRRLYRDLTSKNLEARKKVPGIGPRRAEIVVAGVAAFLRVMELLKIDSLHYSTAGVRDGIIADLAARGVGREVTRLTRQQTRVVDAMCRKYAVDVENARAVARFAVELFEATEPMHKLSAEFGRLLQTAAWLHDVGHLISDTGHHKHSAYIVSNSDMPGYTDRERLIVSLLCRYHRKTLPQQRHDPFKSLSAEEKRAVCLLTPLMRLAVSLDTSKQRRISAVEFRSGASAATLRVLGDDDFDLELWAAERAAESFRQMYDIPLAVERVR